MATTEDSDITQGQRGYASLLFSDLCDYTQLNEASDPEEADSLRRQVEEVAARVISKHRGTISQVYGDGILAVFGFPTPAEDDARRAVEAAIDLHQAIQQAQWEGALPKGFEVRLHTAVHAGPVFGRPGDELHGRYQLIGDTVNTTSRLCLAARRDEILVSKVALHGFEEFFAARPTGPFQFKGKALPVDAYLVTGRSGVRTSYEARSRRGLTEFIGRQREVESLIELALAAHAGPGRLCVVTGPPGIGKSRLLDQFRRLIGERGMRVLRGSCDSYGETAPLEPFLQLLRQLLGVTPDAGSEEAIAAIDDALAEMAEMARHRSTILHLMSLLPWPEDPRWLARFMPDVADAVCDLIAELGRKQPLVLILDDWHWADDASRGVLARLCDDFVQRRICVVVGTRDLALSTLQPARVLALDPFSEDESARVVSALRPRDFELGRAGAMHLRSGGNPLFLEELCRALPSDDPTHTWTSDQSVVPTTLQSAIHGRLAAFSPERLRTLRAASVIGVEFSCSMLSGLLKAANTEEILEGLTEEDVVYRTETPDIFRFKHGIARDVVYDSVRISRRRSLHRLVAAAIEPPELASNITDQTEMLAYHHRCAGDHERAAFYAELAGNKAMATSSLDRARFHYGAALSSLDELPTSSQVKRRWLAISAKWATPCSYDPGREQLKTLQRAATYATEVGDLNARAHNDHWLGWFYYVLGDFSECIDAYEEGLELARQAQDEKLEAQLCATLGQAYAAAGEYERALPLLLDGLERKRSNARGQSRGRAWSFAHALACKAGLHAVRGEFEVARQDLKEAFGMVGGTGHAMEASLLALSCLVYLRQGAFAECATAAARARETSARANSMYVFAMSRILGGYAQFMLEPDPTRLEPVRRDIEWLEARGQVLNLSSVYGWMAEAHLDVGDLANARAFADRALARVTRRDPLGEAAACRVMGRLPGVESTPARAQAWFERAWRSAELRQAPRESALTDLAAAEAGPSELARTYAERALAGFERSQMAWHAERARRLLSEL